MLSEQENKKVHSFLDEISQKVDPLILEIVQGNVMPKFQKAVRYQLTTGGKRFRPALAIATCHLLGGKIQDVIRPACGLEIFHNYTLIIDDIIDNGLFRRNKPTVWAKYGKAIADCIAMDYVVSIFQTTQKSPKSIEINKLFALTMKILVDGEILDILFEREGRKDEPFVVSKRPKTITFEKYLEMITKKTAVLLSACCEVGGITANANTKQISSLGQYGLNLGIAFQMQDDILDMFGEEKEFGKKIGKDIEERKGGNLVFMMAFKELSAKDRSRVAFIMGQAKITEPDKKEVLNLIRKTNALSASQKMAKLYSEKAKKALSNLPQNSWSQLLANLADFVIERKK